MSAFEFKINDNDNDDAMMTVMMVLITSFPVQSPLMSFALFRSQLLQPNDKHRNSNSDSHLPDRTFLRCTQFSRECVAAYSRQPATFFRLRVTFRLHVTFLSSRAVLRPRGLLWQHRLDYYGVLS